MAEQRRWGILATGAIAREFAQVLAGSPHGELVAVASRDGERARAMAAEFGAHGYGSYEELLAAPEIDVVYIATPHPQHAPWALRAAAAGKDILCEKPLTVSLSEALAVVGAARERGVLLVEAFMYRFHPQTRALVELIERGAIGDVRLIRATFSFDAPFQPGGRLFANELAGGAILDVGCYPASIARLLAGAALGRPFADPLELTGAARLNPRTGVDDYAVATLLFEDGIVAQLTCGVRLRAPFAIEVLGSDGKIAVEAPAWLPQMRPSAATQIALERYGEPVEIVQIADPGPSFGLEVEAMARYAGAAEAAEMPLDDSLGNMATLDRWRAAVGLVYDFESESAGD